MPINPKAPRGTVLLVEPDRRVVETESRALEARAYTVLRAPTPDDARALLARAEPDVVVVSPRTTSAAALRSSVELGRDTKAPLVIWSAARDPSYRVMGLRMGADDVIAKPADPNELDARLEAVIRRGSRGRVPPRPAERAVVGPLVVDQRRRAALLNGDLLPLTPSELRLLTALTEQPGRARSFAELASAVWGDGVADPRAKLVPHVARLRAKLAGRGGAPAIVGVRGFGYRLEARPGYTVRRE